MKVAVLSVYLIFMLGVATTHAAEQPSTNAPEALILSNLGSPIDIQDAIFEWHNLPGWIFTDVVFGVRQGELVFAKYTAVPPNGRARYHDKSAEVDYLIEDTRKLREMITIDLGNSRKALIESFSIGILSDGRAVIDSARGFDGLGKVIDISADKAGPCGSPRVVGSCNDICSNICVPDVPSGDPCVCNGSFGGCTSGSAQWVCNTGQCTQGCLFQPGGCICV